MLLIVLQNNPEQRDSLSEMNSKVVSTRELLENAYRICLARQANHEPVLRVIGQARILFARSAASMKSDGPRRFEHIRSFSFPSFP